MNSWNCCWANAQLQVSQQCKMRRQVAVWCTKRTSDTVGRATVVVDTSREWAPLKRSCGASESGTERDAECELFCEDFDPW